MTGWTKWATALAVAGLALVEAAPAIAEGDTTVAVQRLGPPEVEARREALLQQMIARPSDLDLAFEYAQLSAQVGDYEGAVSTLERMLIYAPNTPRLQLELGILYYKLGSYEVARTYFAQVVSIQACRRRSPPRCASICSSSPSKPSLLPSPDQSSAASAGRATPTQRRQLRTSR